jgi:hypothetical protein
LHCGGHPRKQTTLFVQGNFKKFPIY